ncbi:hypothetical protein B7494_g6664 [Chlorociboria aeruginascens]|nr:hypothetical protein B7494_g6664 [Chlorociboria aeruginascens]
MTAQSSKSIYRVLLASVYTTIALLATLVIIKYNTIIHPFTLADNRHYVFYVFRYTILRHSLIRYLLAPIYLLCLYLAYSTLAGPSRTIEFKPSSSKPTPKSKILDHTQEMQQAEGPTTSFFLILLLSTSLSLVTAPLVEPRYFIIPWLFWRLHIPSSSPEAKKMASIDYVLLFETVWFLAINAVTGYVFLYRGFEWVQEEGKVQRFMW